MGLMHALRKTYYKTVTRRIPQVHYEPQALATRGFKSQYGQDQFVVERLGGKRGGVFVDVGAFDGVTLSNTWYLEQQLGWSGICIEPSRSAFAQLQQRRNCALVHGCIAATPGRARFLEIEGAAAMLSGRLDEYHPRHRERIDREIAQQGGQRQELDVPCYTIPQLASKYGLTEIDYLSIDTEGGELAILRSIDFSQLPVRLISVENNYADLEFGALLRRFGFALIAKIACDEIYENETWC